MPRTDPRSPAQHGAPPEHVCTPCAARLPSAAPTTARPLRVLIISQGVAVDGQGGGIDRFCSELVRAFDRRQVEPTLCAMWQFGTSGEPQLLDHLRQEGIPAFMASRWDSAHPYRSFARAAYGAWRHLAGQQMDVIHSHFEFADGIALLLALPLKTRLLLRTVHNEREWRRRPLRRLFLTNLLYPLAFRTEIGISQQVAQNLSSRTLPRCFGTPSPCIPNAIDLERFSRPKDPLLRERKRSELGLPPRAPVIGTIGRLSQQKGFSVLVDAAAALVAELPQIHVLILGEGELKEELRAQAAQLGIADHIHLVGARLDIEEILPAMDIFASSSLWEGLPTVLLEAMAAGVPVVATDVSGSRELIEDGATGLLVSPADHRAIAAALARLLREPSLGAALAARARTRVEDFSIRQVARRHVELYTRLLGRTRHKPAKILQTGD